MELIYLSWTDSNETLSNDTKTFYFINEWPLPQFWPKFHLRRRSYSWTPLPYNVDDKWTVKHSIPWIFLYEWMNVWMNEYDMSYWWVVLTGGDKFFVLPITGHEGPEGEWRYSPTLSWPRGETVVLEDKSITVPLCPSRIPLLTALGDGTRSWRWRIDYKPLGLWGVASKPRIMKPVYTGLEKLAFD